MLNDSYHINLMTNMLIFGIFMVFVYGEKIIDFGV